MNRRTRISGSRVRGISFTDKGEGLMPRQDVRVLLGWMERDEAIATQLGSRLPTQGEDVGAQLNRWTDAQRAVAARPAYDLQTPVLDPLPEQLRQRGEAFLRRPDVAGPYAGWDIAVGMADLTKALSFQKLVTADAVERVAAIDPHDENELFSFCLPDPVDQIQVPASLDQDGRGFAISSANPNLRLLGGQLANINGSQFYGFAMGFGSTYVQVVEFQGRWFVRDGYHRCYGLLRSGVDHIPCLFIRAQNVQQFAGTAPGFFRWDIIFGARPPYLRDFLDDSVAETVQRPVVGKVIRITAQEFAVQL